MPGTRRLSAELAAELELLARYNLESRLNGVKIHHDAPDEVVEAAERLYRKGIITNADGGYLTDRGLEVAEPLQRVLDTLEFDPKP